MIFRDLTLARVWWSGVNLDAHVHVRRRAGEHFLNERVLSRFPGNIVVGSIPTKLGYVYYITVANLV